MIPNHSDSMVLKNEIIRTEERKGYEQTLIDKDVLKDYDSTSDRFNQIV